VANLKDFPSKTAESADITLVITDPCIDTEIDVSQAFETLSVSVEGASDSLTFVEFPNSVSTNNVLFGNELCGP
jgi:hypothetical protein